MSSLWSDLRLKAEWPTWVVHAACMGGLLALTGFGAWLPWWVLAPVGGYLVCLYGSLQHEALHGHPTRSAALNEALVFIPFPLWFPYRRYRDLHLAHHDNDILTLPGVDPESYYLEPAAWNNAGAPIRAILRLNNTLAGRLAIGPFISLAGLVRDDLAAWRAGEKAIATAWALHAVGAVALIAWLELACGMATWRYLAFVAWPGVSLTLLRSFAEHRAHERATCRTVIVETNPVMALMFLNNNLHAAHHQRPGLSWFRLPAYYAANKQRLTKDNCGYMIAGYGRLVARYLLRAKEPVAHPLM